MAQKEYTEKMELSYQPEFPTFKEVLLNHDPLNVVSYDGKQALLNFYEQTRKLYIIKKELKL